jgi:ATP-binding protein involved in chromosome partitioning
MTAESQNGTNNPADNQDRDKITTTLTHIRHKLLVMSGKGGVGKSSVSASLAIRLAARGLRVGLLDVDIHGPSLAGIMGIEGLLDVDAEKRVLPKSVTPRLSMVSMQSLMPNADQAVIWRGPAKTGVIRQFIGDVFWGTLDYLVIDAPPGTGDEPLSVAQTVPDAKAVIVTTPQEVALGDVRKSINFCRAINLSILGLIENMGPFACPCCGKGIELFKSGGGEPTAAQMEIPFLGTLPFDSDIVKACDSGLPAYMRTNTTAFTEALDAVVAKIMAGCNT